MGGGGYFIPQTADTSRYYKQFEKCKEVIKITQMLMIL